MKIGIVGGAGWLGRSFARAFVDKGLCREDELVLSYRGARATNLSAANWTQDNQAVFDQCDVIIISVRPHDFYAVTPQTKGRLVISVMAGITMAQLGARFGTDRVVRCLPNGAAEVGKSYTPWVGDRGIGAEDRALVQRLLECCGAADEVANEDMIDYFTGMTGSGPAFPALLASAMMHDAMARGFDAKVAQKAVLSLLIGTGRLLENRPESPDAIVQVFMDYRGTTAAAMEAMRAAGFEEAVRKGLAAALAKSKDMGG